MTHPGLHGGGIDPARQPEAGGRLPKIVDTAAACGRGPVERALEGGRVQLVVRGGDGQSVVGFSACGE
jgi:hypothetical protein